MFFALKLNRHFIVYFLLSKYSFIFYSTLREYLVCIDEDTSKVVGVVCYKETSGYSTDHVGLGYVSVAQNYKNKKIATTLLRMLFEKIALLGKKGLRVGSTTVGVKSIQTWT